MQANDDIYTLQLRVERLKLEHRDLDDIITTLTQITPHDQLQVQRLKKRKLTLKDQIVALERQLTRECPALAGVPARQFDP